MGILHDDEDENKDTNYPYDDKRSDNFNSIDNMKRLLTITTKEKINETENGTHSPINSFFSFFTSYVFALSVSMNTIHLFSLRRLPPWPAFVD